MASRTAKIASSIGAGILAGTLLIAPRSAANAAECLTEPGKDATRGQHWFYRIEHGSKRHCWYLRDTDGTAAQGEPLDDSEQAPKAAAASNENPPGAVQNAHAEYPMPQVRGNTVAAPAPSPSPLASSPVPALPQADVPGSAVAARWPSLQTAPAPAATAPAGPAPAAIAPAAPATADATDSSPVADEAADAPTDTPAPAQAAANPAPAKPSVSLQMLFAVIGGALALAGLTASIVYRLGRRRLRRLDTRERRAVLWEAVDNGPRPPWVPPEVEDSAPLPLPERRPAQTVKPQERYEKIEEILAQLVRQAQQSDA